MPASSTRTRVTRGRSACVTGKTVPSRRSSGAAWGQSSGSKCSRTLETAVVVIALEPVTGFEPVTCCLRKYCKWIAINAHKVLVTRVIEGGWDHRRVRGGYSFLPIFNPFYPSFWQPFGNRIWQSSNQYFKGLTFDAGIIGETAAKISPTSSGLKFGPRTSSLTS
jgi:hypothetical protein